MRSLILITLLALGLTASASANQCSTQCYRNWNGNTCYTSCN